MPSLSRVINSRDVIIDSGSLYNPQDLDVFSVKEEQEEVLRILEWESPFETNIDVDKQSDDILEVTVPTTPNKIKDEKSKQENSEKKTEIISGGDVRGALPPINDEKKVLPESKSNPSWHHSLVSPELDERNIIGAGRTRSQVKKAAIFAQQYHLSFSAAYSSSKKVKSEWSRDVLPQAPKGWQQMLRHKFSAEFQRAAEKEYSTLEQKETWIQVDKSSVPEDSIIIPLIWIFSYKFDSEGILTKFKARLCARGDLQLTDEDTYAATLASQSFRALMAITAAHDLEIRQYDVVNAFVNAPIRGEIFCHTPQGFDNEMNNNKAILKLKRALYGLKSSPVYWYDELVSFLLNHGLYQVPGVNCIFTNEGLNLIFYVDDILITFHNKDAHLVENFERDLTIKFEIRKLLENSPFLGINIVRDRSSRRLWLSQSGYIESLK